VRLAQQGLSCDLGEDDERVEENEIGQEEMSKAAVH
jgi:hypothetical protein